MMDKLQVIAINKIDLPVTRKSLKKEIDIFKEKGIKIFAFSAATGEGINAVIQEITKILHVKKVI